MPIIHSGNIANSQILIRDSKGYYVSSSLAMLSNIMSKEALVYSFDGVGSEGFTEKSEIDLDTEFVKKGVTSSINRESNIDVQLFSDEEIKELEDMISSLDKSMDFCNGFDPKGYLGGGEIKNGGLSSITPVGYIPESPSYSPFEKDSGMEHWDLNFDACKAAIEYQQKYCPISSPASNYEQDRVPSPDYAPECLPSPNYASPFENWSPDYVCSDVSSPDYTLESSDNVPSSSKSPKRKAVDDWDLESHSPKAKRPRMELVNSEITDASGVKIVKGGWAEEWIMTETGGWLDE